ncbi:MAG: pilus assembly protein [Rhodobacteraceae bacterium]|nr:pilus assembly protein [Paracoccaceae bacterium]
MSRGARLIGRAARRLGRAVGRVRHGAGALRRDDGAVTVEFVLYFPLFLIVFMSAFESGLLTLRQVMLDRGVDISVRNLRLGLWDNPTPEMLRDAICENAAIIADCDNVLLLELLPIDASTWALPAPGAVCINRDEEVQPVTAFVPGGFNQPMLVRACAIMDPIFPWTGIGQAMAVDTSGGYAVTAASAFVNEP